MAGVHTKAGKARPLVEGAPSQCCGHVSRAGVLGEPPNISTWLEYKELGEHGEPWKEGDIRTSLGHCTTCYLEDSGESWKVLSRGITFVFWKDISAGDMKASRKQYGTETCWQIRVRDVIPGFLTSALLPFGPE